MVTSAEPPAYLRADRPGPIGVWTKFAQAIGSIPDTVMTWVFNTFVLLYYNQILGLDPIRISAVLAGAIVVDAVADPWLASISDNLDTRFGRRHPLMLAGGVPAALFAFAVFRPPAGLGPGGLTLWLGLWVVLARIAMSVFFVPWAAIGAELSDDYDERTSVMSWRYAVGWAVSIAFPVVLYTLIMPSRPGHPPGQLIAANYPGMAIAAASLVALGALATTLLTWREIPYLRRHAVAQAPPGPVTTAREVALALGNDQFRLIFVLVLILSVIGGATQNISIYMATYFWGLTTETLRWLTLAAGFGAACAFPFVAFVQTRWDKRAILIVTAVAGLVSGLTVVGLRLLGLLPPNGDPWLIRILTLDVAFASGIAVVNGIIGASVVADILDQHELETGYRQEAMFNAALSFSGKAMSGVGIVVSGVILTVIGFPAHADPAHVRPDAIHRLGVIVGLVIPSLNIIPIWLARQYKITRAAHDQIRARLLARRGEAPA